MLFAALILAATVVSPLQLPSTVTKGEVSIDLTRDVNGMPVRAVVRRTDGKPMTHCDAYTATLEQTYGCHSGDCSSGWSVATGVGYGSSDTDACDAAKADMCQYATCYSGTYQYCATSISQTFSLVSESGGSCTYTGSGSCYVSMDCN